MQVTLHLSPCFDQILHIVEGYPVPLDPNN